ncbi:MAG: stage II sporulation protein R [Clostridia bacterium]|nr:stage II sporulation protein R [Clostridia bacterium]
MRFFSTLIVCLTTFLTLWGFIPTAEECEIYDSTLRLHVIANSDSESDQAVKLKVRDEILEYISGYDVKTKHEALAMVIADTEKIEQIATRVLRENGKADNVKIEIGEEEYPLRSYDGFSLPAGTYTSVRVVIGEGEGQNWWCVLFPPMCTSFATELDDDNYISVGLSGDQYDLITGSNGEYKVKFKLLEIAAEAFGIEY